MADKSPLPDGTKCESMALSITHLNNDISTIYNKIDAMFRRLDESRADSSVLFTQVAVLSEQQKNISSIATQLSQVVVLAEQVSMLKDEMQEIHEGLFGSNGIANRQRTIEIKIGKIFAISSAIIVAVGIAASVVSLIF